MKEYTSKQPMNGETVMHCGHIDQGHKFHWHKFHNEVYFRRPDGSVGTSIWIVACDDCHNAAGGDGLKIDILGDSVWVGDEPIIEERKK